MTDDLTAEQKQKYRDEMFTTVLPRSTLTVEPCNAIFEEQKDWLEAIRTGFRWAWQQNDYNAILDVAEKIPEDVLHEDAMLLMWYTNSLIRTGRGA